MSRVALCLSGLGLLLGLCLVGGLVSPAVADAAEPARPWPLVREVDVRLPSAVARPRGLLVRVAVPERGRYESRAPVVIHVPDGWLADGLEPPAVPLAAYGCIELRLVFPGEGRGRQQSGGRWDARGPLAAQALADAVAFAAGRSATAEGQRLAAVVGNLEPLTGQLGVVAWGGGGNVIWHALADHEQALRSVAWVVLWQPPYGVFGVTQWLGWANRVAQVDRRARWRWSPALRPALIGPGAEAAPPGSLYDDVDGDGRPSDGDGLPRAVVAFDAAGRLRVVFGPTVLREARLAMPTPWPSAVATVAETAAYWAARDGATALPRAAALHPDLRLVVGPTSSAPAQQLAHELAPLGLGFVQRAPQAAYVAALGGPAGDGAPADAAVSHAQSVLAAALELADRSMFANDAPTLTAPLAPTAALTP